MQKLTFVNARGESITFGNEKPFILSHIDGTGGVAADLKTTKSPYQDGSTLVGVTMEDRLVSITGAIMATTREEMYQLRRRLTQILNSKSAGKLIYTNDAHTYVIDAVPDGSPAFGDRHANNQLFAANFICPDPFWTDENEIVKALKFEEGGLTFPLRLSTMFAFSAYRGIFTNSGDVDTPVTVHYRGPAKNPLVMNETTGEFIKVNYDLTDEDVLEISTAFGRKRVEVVNDDGTRTNVFHWIDLDSTFFQLVPGENMLRYDSDEEADRERANVTVYWHNRYSGG